MFNQNRYINELTPFCKANYHVFLDFGPCRYQDDQQGLSWSITMQLAMINDQITPLAQVDPAFLDRGTFFGDGVYEVIRSYNGKIFAIEQHLRRFESSLDAIEIHNVDIDKIRRHIDEAFAAAAIPNAKIYFHMTRGLAPRNHGFDDHIRPNFFLTVTELDDDSQQKTHGIAVSTAPDLRWKRCDIKSLNLLPNILARHDAERKGCDEAIFIDDAGLITEGAGSAFFAIIAGKLRTAPLTANILPSVTRAFVIKAAQQINLPVVEESLTAYQAAGADELFIAVTTKDIVPVVKFDGHDIADAKPGKYTKMLIDQFHSFT